MSKQFKQHQTLRRGTHHNRTPLKAVEGVYAFSRIELTNPVEYLLVLNTSLQAKNVVLTSQVSGYTDISNLEDFQTDNGTVNLKLNGLSYKILKANSPMPNTELSQLILVNSNNYLSKDNEVHLSYQLSKAVSSPPVMEMTTEVSIDNGPFTKVSFDNTLPLTARFNLSRLPTGKKVTVRSTLENFSGQSRQHTFSFNQ